MLKLVLKCVIFDWNSLLFVCWMKEIMNYLNNNNDNSNDDYDMYLYGVVFM